MWETSPTDLLMASSNRPHTPGTGARVTRPQSESNYISWTRDHLFFQENGAASQVSMHLGFCSSFNTALSSVTRFWGQTFQKAPRLRALLLPAMVHLKTAPSFPTGTCLSHTAQAVSSVVHRLLSTFPLLFQILNLQTTQKKSSCSHETSAPASIQDRCCRQCTRVFCPLLLQRNQGLAPAIPISLTNLSIT